MRNPSRSPERPRRNSGSHPGDRWALRRAFLGMSERDVERACTAIANSLQNEQFKVSDSLVRSLERRSVLPTAAKFYSLCSVYQVSPFDAYSWYGIPFRQLFQERLSTPSARTTLVNLDVTEIAEPAPFPVSSDSDRAPDTTALLSQFVAPWGDSLAAFLAYFVDKRFLFGKVGKNDRFLFPLVLPGSLLVIDPSQTTLPTHQQGSHWKRPIYFLQLPSEYLCGYCELLSNGRLLLRPHPDSPAESREIAFPDESKVIGRVTSIAIPDIDRYFEGS